MAMRQTREHASERPGKVGHLIGPNGDAHGLINGQVAIGIEQQRGNLGPQALQRMLRERYAEMQLQSLVNAAHARAAAARENQSANFIILIDHECSPQWSIVARAGGGCHRDP